MTPSAGGSKRALHDGAQQHLTGIAIRLEEARQTPGIGPEDLVRKLDDTVAELRDAINELRELARGIHPAILTEAGLEPALATLARRSPVPVDLRVELDGHGPSRSRPRSPRPPTTSSRRG